MFTQSDVHEGNFLLDTEDKMCLVDFGDVALLPESFGNYGMAWKLPFIEKVASYLDWPRDNVKSMGKARGLLLMIGDPRLGTSICTRYRILPNTRDRSEQAWLSQWAGIGFYIRPCDFEPQLGTLTSACHRILSRNYNGPNQSNDPSFFFFRITASPKIAALSTGTGNVNHALVPVENKHQG